ncbi:MAG: branched-chain amino acid transaminase [Candidatus Aureabacteria bacterium]|nr:branched-chain amino acid transaminase [Candidatus Auribacterota bacterium]
MANVTTGKKIWMNGGFRNWEECQIHIMSHVIHYGSSVFEGIRCYEAKNNSVIFRLRDHMQRLLDSAKVYRMNVNYNVEQLCDMAVNLVRENKMKDCYIRPIIYRGFGAFGLIPFDSPVETACICWSWGAYLGQEALEKGIEVKVSTWNRMAPNTLPSMAKAGGNYLNSQLIKMEAIGDGYGEGIALDHQGLLSEGSGENLFLVKNGKIFTPTTGSSILPGITRHSIILLAREMGLTVKQQNVPREALYMADEVFLTGTAAEITPVCSVDRIQIGQGKRGPVTQQLQEGFFRLLRQETKDNFGWLTQVY